MGPVRGVGFGGQRSVRPTSEADEQGGIRRPVSRAKAADTSEVKEVRMFKQSPVARWRLAVVLALAFSATAGLSTAWAQAAASSTIHGEASDDTGAALPGVTVTLSSPQLQAQKRVTVTQPDGTYRFTELPAGTYE